MDDKINLEHFFFIAIIHGTTPGEIAPSGTRDFP